MKTKYCIALDVGGTSINSAVVSSEGRIVNGSPLERPIDSKARADQIIDTFLTALHPLFQFAEEKKIKIAGLGVGFPGPFDYENGICRIKGVDKYESIYGMNLKEILWEKLNLNRNFPIFFENDGWTFTRGEAWRGAGSGYNRIIGLTLGTGLGSGFYVNDDLVDSSPGVPSEGWFGGMPYGESIIDDYISKRAIISLYLNKNAKQKTIDVEEIARRARLGEQKAISVFSQIGSLLGKLLQPVARDFKPECIVVGGKIARSFDLFSTPLRENLSQFGFIKKIDKARNTQTGGILGAGKLLFKRIE